MNVRKVKAQKTVKLSPYGRVPIKDAKEDVTLQLTLQHLKDGKKNVPNACAIAIATPDNAKLFPGKFLGAWVYKTYTLIATEIGQRIQARRYHHSETLRLAINGFDLDKGTERLKPGPVTLSAPIGIHKLGVANGTSGPGNAPVTTPRAKVCRKRGVFVNPFHAKQAEREMAGTKDQVVEV